MNSLHKDQRKVAVVGANLSNHFYNFLELQGYQIQLLPENTAPYPPVNNHPDLYGTPLPENQWLLEPSLYDLLAKRFGPLDRRRFYRGEKPLGASYPETCSYNHLVINNRLVGCKSCLHPQVITMAKKSNLKLECVKQGYVRCTTALLGSQTLLTSDKGIKTLFNRLKKEDAEFFGELEVLEVAPEGIRLSGFSNGFIGGALVAISPKMVYCYGDPTNLQDFNEVYSALKREDIELIYSTAFKIEDIGSALIFEL